MKLAMWTLLATSSIVPLRGQTAEPFKPHNTHIEDPRAEARETTALPHHPGDPQEHPLNRVIVFRQAGKLSLTTAGKTEKFEVNAAGISWMKPGAPYVLEDLSDHPIEIVEIDLKNTPANPPLVMSKLDMLVSDPEHYKLVFENSQVRVLTVRYGPHEKGALHEHARDRIIVNLNGELREKYGDVRLHAPETHAEENQADHADERLVVELK